MLILINESVSFEAEHMKPFLSPRGYAASWRGGWYLVGCYNLFDCGCI